MSRKTFFVVVDHKILGIPFFSIIRGDFDSSSDCWGFYRFLIRCKSGGILMIVCLEVFEVAQISDLLELLAPDPFVNQNYIPI